MLGCLEMSNVVTVKENGGKVTVEDGPLNVTLSLRGTTCTRIQDLKHGVKRPQQQHVPSTLASMLIAHSRGPIELPRHSD